jgi:hypothetical protein
MKKSPLTPALIGVLLVFALAALLLTYLNIQESRKGRALQAMAANINNTRLVMDALAKETIEYGKTHPAMDPILVSVGLKAEQPGASTKPATR